MAERRPERKPLRLTAQEYEDMCMPVADTIDEAVAGCGPGARADAVVALAAKKLDRMSAFEVRTTLAGLAVKAEWYEQQDPWYVLLIALLFNRYVTTPLEITLPTGETVEAHAHLQPIVKRVEEHFLRQ